MEVSASTFLVCFMALETYACGIRLPRQFIAQGFSNQNEESSRLEDVIDLTRPALHTLLKGLAALLVQLYPEIAPRVPTVPPSSSSSKEKEEPIKIFRQIMQIPGPMYPPGPSMYPYHQMQQQQPTPMPRDPYQSLQVPSQDPSQSIQMPQVSNVQMPQTTQITEHCYPANTCCQPNPFSQDQYNC